MPRRTKRGKGPRTRGRHKHRFSAETKVWNKMHRKATRYETYPCVYGHHNCSTEQDGGPCTMHPKEEAA